VTGWVETEPTITASSDPFELDMVHNGPSELIARFVMRSKADWDGEKADRERADAARERRENEIAMMQLRGDPVPTTTDVFRRALVPAEIQDRIGAAAAQRERAGRATFVAADLAARESAAARLSLSGSRPVRSVPCRQRIRVALAAVRPMRRGAGGIGHRQGRVSRARSSPPGTGAVFDDGAAGFQVLFVSSDAAGPNLGARARHCSLGTPACRSFARMEPSLTR
jgi:hypothetical protein